VEEAEANVEESEPVEWLKTKLIVPDSRGS
jgi:hypothetical protein